MRYLKSYNAVDFDDLISWTKSHKTAANWVMGSVKSYLNENGVDIESFPIPSKKGPLKRKGPSSLHFPISGGDHCGCFMKELHKLDWTG